MTKQEIIQALRGIVAEADAMRNAYFFTPAGNAGGRRSYEKRHSHDKIEWEEGGRTYSAAYTVRCSCKNVYTDGAYTRDGKKTTLTAIKNSLRRMEAEEAKNALYNLCFSYCMDGGTEAEPITLQDAAETLQAWRTEDPEILEGLEDVTPEQFRQAWNETVEYLMGGSEKMKKWYLIDSARGDVSSDEMKAKTRAEAETDLLRAWERLTDQDRRQRVEFFAIHADLDADGCVNYDTGDDVIYLMENGTVSEFYAAALDLNDVSEQMDDNIRESVHADLAPCSAVDFLREYCRRHYAAYGERFLDLEF